MATAKIFLDTRYQGKKEDGAEKPCSVKIAINHRSRSCFLLLDIKVLPTQWNKLERRVKNHPQKALFNKVIAEQYAIVESILLQLTQSGLADKMTCSELCNAVKERLNPFPNQEPKPKKKKEEKRIDTLENLFLRYIETHNLSNGTVKIYEQTMRKLEKFLGKKWHTFSVKDVNYAWIEDFEKFLSQTAKSANARGITLREVKAVCRYAYKLEIISRDPFLNFTIRTQKTKKRNMDVDALRRIIFAEVEPWMEKYRDFFVLSFMLRGLNTVDMCHITKPVNGRIEWNRTKTGQPLSLKIEPEMLPYIDRWQGSRLLLQHCENGRYYKCFANQLSNGLRQMVRYINFKYRDNITVPPVTLYWGRHTWATLAAKLDIPLDVIGCGLGHSPKSVTDIYIERDPAKVDRANRKILDYVLYDQITDGAPRKLLPSPVNTLPPAVDVPQEETAEPVKRKLGRPKKDWK